MKYRRIFSTVKPELDSTGENVRISNFRARLFEDIKRSIEERSRTPLNVVVCGPGPPAGSDPTHPFHLREAIKNLLSDIGDRAFYIEDLVRSEEGRRVIEEIEARLGYHPSLREIELEILESTETDKDVHLMERPGAILELRDFEESPVICQKLRIFVDWRYRDKESYVNSLIESLLEKGAKVYWYTDRSDLLRKTKAALIPNRIKKSRLRSG